MPESYVKRQSSRLKKWGKKRYLSGSVPQNIAQVAKDVWYLKGLINSEKKYYDNAQLSNTISYNGLVYNLCAMAQGDGTQQRTGNSIFARSLSVRLTAIQRGASTSNNMKVMIVLDKNADVAAAPAASDILETTGSTNAPLSHLKFPEARNRFKILKVKQIVLNSTNRTQQCCNIYLKMRHHIKFTGTTAASLGKGQLYLVVISDTVAGTDDPAIRYQSRVMYHDN